MPLVFNINSRFSLSIAEDVKIKHCLQTAIQLKTMQKAIQLLLSHYIFQWNTGFLRRHRVYSVLWTRQLRKALLIIIQAINKPYFFHWGSQARIRAKTAISLNLIYFLLFSHRFRIPAMCQIITLIWGLKCGFGTIKSRVDSRDALTLA